MVGVYEVWEQEVQHMIWVYLSRDLALRAGFA